MDILKKKLEQFVPLHFSSPARKSSVAIIFSLDENGYKLFLTKRNSSLGSHAGEISFPGGTYDKEDKNLFETCIREVHEEIFVHLSKKEFLGQLNDIWTLTGYQIRPFVFFKKNLNSLTFNKDEIETVIELPFSFLLNEKNHHYKQKVYKKRTWNSHIYNYQGHEIWGATAHILNSLTYL